MTSNSMTPDAALADVSERQLVRRLGQALTAQAKADSAARPNRAKIAAAIAAVSGLEREMGRRLAEGRWTAWDALGMESQRSDRRGNGEGSVWHDKKADRWNAEITVSGRRYKKVRRTKAEAHDWLRDAVARLGEGREACESRWTVEGWLDHCVTEVWPREGLADSTLRNHRAGIDRWWKPEVGPCRLTTLRPEQVDAVIGKMLSAGLSPNYVRINLAPLLKALRKAVERGHVTRNVASLATRPKLVRRREPKYLTPDEARKLLAVCPDARFGDAIALAMMLGLRRGELLGLCWDRVELDGERAAVTIDRQMTDAKVGPVAGTKTGEKGTRTIPLPQAAVRVLRRRLERQRFEERAAEDAWSNVHDLVFTTPVGTPIDTRNFGRAVEKLTADTLGRQVNPHALRHTAATLMHDAGVSMKVTQTILGHTSSLITERVYVHTYDEQLDAAAAAMDRLLAAH